jgi:hypothetical protein
MSLSAAAKNTMLDNWGVTQFSLHTDYSSSGANEVTGGAPAYARKNVSFSAASSGSKATSTQPVFDVPISTTVRWLGKWISATFAGMEANGGAEKEFSVDISTDVVTCYAHGYANTNTIAFYGDTTPGGLSEGTVYYVRDATTDTFKVAATSGGVAIDLTAVPGAACVVSKIIEEVFSAQGTLTVTSGSWNLNA